MKTRLSYSHAQATNLASWIRVGSFPFKSIFCEPVLSKLENSLSVFFAKGAPFLNALVAEFPMDTTHWAAQVAPLRWWPPGAIGADIQLSELLSSLTLYSHHLPVLFLGLGQIWFCFWLVHSCCINPLVEQCWGADFCRLILWFSTKSPLVFLFARLKDSCYLLAFQTQA